ncbi:MAG: outer membrane protein assembly factor BamD [Candidatus Omnitrophota bacterium]
MFKRTVLFLSFLTVFLPSVFAYWVWSPEAGKFINTEVAEQDTADEQYQYAMQFYKEKNYDDAIKQLEHTLKRYPEAHIASEAQYRLGIIYEEQGNYEKAFEAYKALVTSYPSSDRINEVIEREFRIGNLFLSGKKGKLMGIEILPAIPRAIDVFKHIVEQAPYSDYGDKAQFHLGLAYRKAGKFDDAVTAFQLLIDQYPQSALLADARFQLAETSFQKSTAQFRDQRALEEASEEIDKFLSAYPDSSASEKAAKIRQVIDEKNAEKNYRIGLYYEKTDYLKSALIYYSDVAKRYPHTQWGQKASQKLRALEEPASVLAQQTEELDSQIKDIEQRLQNLSPEDQGRKEDLKKKLGKLEDQRKAVEKGKSETLRSRTADLRRRERELKEKYQKFTKKKKLLQKNPSDDLEKALARWQASLDAEKAQIESEKLQLKDWRHDLGMDSRTLLDLIPFLGDEGPAVEEIRSIEAKELIGISHAKEKLLNRAEDLYRERDQILAQSGQVRTVLSAATPVLSESQRLAAVKATEGLTSVQMREKAIDLEKLLKEKEMEYQARFGMPPEPEPMGRGAEASNAPGTGAPYEGLPIESLLEQQMRLKEKTAAKRGLVEALQQVFDVELANQERKRIMEAMAKEPQMDVGEFRKQIRQVERAVRGNYEEIEDRHAKKQALVDQLEAILMQEEKDRGLLSNVAQAVAKPVTVFAGLTRGFIRGSPHKDVTVTQTAAQLRSDSTLAAEAEDLKKQIEEESLLIEVRSVELENLKKKLEMMRAQAALAGGYKFRSAVVELPDSYIRDAVEGANRVLGAGEREEMLVALLDKETQDLESLKREMVFLQKAIDQKTGNTEQPSPGSETPAALEPETSEALLKKERVKLFGEIRELQLQIEALKTQAEKETERAIPTTPATSSEEAIALGLSEKEKKQLRQDEKRMDKKLRKIHDEIEEVIKDETRLLKEEQEILQKRLKKTAELEKEGGSKAEQADLRTEKERMEERMKQIALRLDYLAHELQNAKEGADR